MNQSSFTAAMLAAAFVLFLAARNRLSAYTAVLWGNTAAALPSASTSTAAAPTDKIVGKLPGSPGLDLSNPLAGMPSWVGTILNLGAE